MKNKNTFSVFALIMLLLTFVMPFNYVNADENYYYFEPEGQIVTVYTTSTNRNIRVKANTGWRCVNILRYANLNSGRQDYNTACVIEGSGGTWPQYSSNNGNFSNFYYNASQSYNNVLYTVSMYSDFFVTSSYTVSSDYGIYVTNNTQSVGGTDVNNQAFRILAIRLTYGDLAHEQEPPIQAGDLTFNYYTDFASTQSYSIGALKSNRDTITWEYNNTSTSNIPLLDLKVDIRAVPTNYYAASQDALNSLGWSDLHLDLSYASDLGSYQINNGSVSYTWEQVVNNFAVETNLPEWMETVMNFWSNGFYKIYNNLYYAAGWVYQIRLNTWSGDYTGEWQTIYTVPAAPPDGQQQTINYYVNGTGITEPIYQTIQNINNQNNISNNTWYVNGAPVDVDESSEGESWLEKLVKMIWNFITSIFQFNDTDLTIPDWDLNIQNLKDNTGIFGQSIRAIDQIKLRFDALQDAQPVFSFPGFSLDNVQLVPSFSVNLNDVVEDMGLEGLHNTELVIMDGVVYLSLILFAKAQLERILKK